jgi:hypothetical protein
MTSNEARNELKVMVGCDLAATCMKVAENSQVPDNIRETAHHLVKEWEALLEFRGKGNPMQHAQGEIQLAKMARSLPTLIEVQSWPPGSSTV